MKTPHVCKTCCWWVPGRKLAMPNGQAELPGECRRNPPQARWPHTDAGDWCGEHSALHERLKTPDDALARLDQELAAGQPAVAPSQDAASSTSQAAGPADQTDSAATEAPKTAPVRLENALARPRRR